MPEKSINAHFLIGLKLLASIGGTELLIMVIFRFIGIETWLSPLLIDLTDTLLLCVTASFLILYWVVNPMKILEERKQAEEKFHKEKAFSEAMLDSLPGIFYVFDHTGRFLRWNRALETIWDPAEEIAAMSPLDFFSGDDRTLIEERTGKVFETGAADADAALLTKDGRRVPHYLVGVRFELDGVPCCIGMGIDITERKEMERKLNEYTENLEQMVRERTHELQAMNRELVLRREEADAASKSKSDFLATMSHELRTPLNAILGFSEIMQQGMAGPLTEKQMEFLVDISTSGNHLLALITDILDLSKIEAGKLELEMSVFSLKELIEASLAMFKEKALKHRINVTSDIDASITPITADRRKLKQVLVNLLSNAFKFTQDRGSVRVTARKVVGDQGSDVRKQPTPDLRPQTPNGNFIEISVTDTGIGISEENQQRLFQPFQQIETSLTRKYAGTGLGLSLCRRLVELHGGSIWVESEEGKERWTPLVGQVDS